MASDLSRISRALLSVSDKTGLVEFARALAARGEPSPIEKTVEYLSERPARFFGLWPSKGALLVGADADVAVIAPADWTYDSSRAHDDLNWSPYDGERFLCRVAATFIGGRKGWDGATILSKPGWGAYAARGGGSNTMTSAAGAKR